MKGRKFLELLSDYWFPKKISALVDLIKDVFTTDFAV
jgi:hypothetical protein